MGKYESFAELSAHEVYGRDYRVRAVERTDSPVLVLAPHGGGIEIGTSEVAARIARGRHSLFLFEGRRPPWQNRGLHITSHKFDHPQCLALVMRSAVTLAIHGCKGESQVFLGGLDVELKTLLAARLDAAGFPARLDGHPYQGLNPLNICNRGTRGNGAQVELTRDFREPAARAAVAAVLRNALDEYLAGALPALPATRA